MGRCSIEFSSPSLYFHPKPLDLMFSTRDFSQLLVFDNAQFICMEYRTLKSETSAERFVHRSFKVRQLHRNAKWRSESGASDYNELILMILDGIGWDTLPIKTRRKVNINVGLKIQELMRKKRIQQYLQQFPS